MAYNAPRKKKKTAPLALQKLSLLQHALEGEQPEVRAIVDAALKQGTNNQDVYRHVLIPALQELGDAWAKGKISIAQEHVATEIIASELSALRCTLSKSKQSGFTALFAALPGDLHTLGPRIVADYFLMDGWKVSFLGNNTPAAEILEFARERKVNLVGLSVSLTKHVDEITALIGKLRKLSPAPKILIGGRAASKLKQASPSRRADAFPANAESAISAAHRLMGERSPATSLESLAREIGARIKANRSRKSLSQLELSRGAGLDRAYLSAIENGKHNATIGALLQIANALELTVEDLIGERRGSSNSSQAAE